ncbi:hypothetical protein LTR53_018367, partial [Teratosphaeriaceae sp. CCFEE 6253]
KEGTVAGGSNLSALYTAPHHYTSHASAAECRAGADGHEHDGDEKGSRQEVLINGLLQGRLAPDPRGASSVSRRLTCERFAAVLRLAGTPALLGAGMGYAELKACDALKGRETVKRDVRARALGGWVRNTGDDGWAA